jgi:hypothetical protein
MKYIKTFESFKINEEENVFKAVGGFFGRYNEDTKERAEKKIEEYSKEDPTSVHVKIFNQLRDAYDNNSETTLVEERYNYFKYPTTKLTSDEVAEIFEEICCIIRMNEAHAFGIRQNKERKLEAYQTKTYSSRSHGFGSGVSGH